MTVHEHVADIADEMVILGYRNTVGELVGFQTGGVAAAERFGTPFRIGVSTETNEEAGCVYCTFNDYSRDDMAAVLTETENAVGLPRLRGFAVEDYATWAPLY